jgi:hypothetical protein
MNGYYTARPSGNMRNKGTDELPFTNKVMSYQDIQTQPQKRPYGFCLNCKVTIDEDEKVYTLKKKPVYLDTTVRSKIFCSQCAHALFWTANYNEYANGRIYEINQHAIKLLKGIEWKEERVRRSYKPKSLRERNSEIKKIADEINELNHKIKNTDIPDFEIYKKLIFTANRVLIIKERVDNYRRWKENCKPDSPTFKRRTSELDQEIKFRYQPLVKILFQDFMELYRQFPIPQPEYEIEKFCQITIEMCEKSITEIFRRKRQFEYLEKKLQELESELDNARRSECLPNRVIKKKR